MATIKLPMPTLGMDLLTEETSMKAGTVRKAVNVDINSAGGVRRRGGYAVAVPGTGFHSIFSSALGVFVGNGPNLFQLDPDTLQLTFICAMGSAEPLSFSEYNDALYVTNPSSLWRVTAAGASPVGVPAPQRPSVVPHPAGTLVPGRYGVAISAVVGGEESPALYLGEYQLDAGLKLTDLLLRDGARYRVYITPQNGDVLYLCDEFDAAFTEYVVSVTPDGAPCQTLNMEPMPAGSIVLGTRGRLYVAAGSVLWYSEALRPHLLSPRSNFIPFVGDIRFLASVDDGLYVADDRGVWWLPGMDPTAASMVQVSQIKVVKHSATTVPSDALPASIRGALDDAAVWLSESGYMVGRAGGSVVPLHPERIKLSPDQEGRSVLMVRGGIKQVITLTAAPATSVFGLAADTSIQ